MKRTSLKWIGVFSAAFMLTNCAYEGDFGRLEDSKLKRKYNNAVGSIQRETGLLADRAAYHIPLTQEERTIRQIYAHFRRPIKRSRKFRDPEKPVTFTDHHSPKSFHDWLATNMRTDTKYVKHLRRVIKAIIHQDIQRYEVVGATYDVTENDSRFIRVRISENRAVMMRAMKAIDKRIADYNQLIEYAHLQIPSREVNQLQRPLDALRTESAVLKANYESYVYNASEKFAPIPVTDERW